MKNRLLLMTVILSHLSGAAWAGKESIEGTTLPPQMQDCMQRLHARLDQEKGSIDRIISTQEYDAAAFLARWQVWQPTTAEDVQKKAKGLADAEAFIRTTKKQTEDLRKDEREHRANLAYTQCSQLYGSQNQVPPARAEPVPSVIPPLVPRERLPLVERPPVSESLGQNYLAKEPTRGDRKTSRERGDRYSPEAATSTTPRPLTRPVEAAPATTVSPPPATHTQPVTATQVPPAYAPPPQVQQQQQPQPQTPPNPQVTADGGCLDTAESRRPLVMALAQTLTQNLNDKSQRTGSSGATGLFAGNFDWHSAVFGAWALLGISRYVGDTTAAKSLLQVMTVGQLQQEWNSLIGQSDIMPYAVGLFSLLLSEVEVADGQLHVVKDRQGLAELRTEVLNWLASWLLKSTTLDATGKSGGDLCGAHHYSWLPAYMLFRLSRPYNTFAALSGRVSSVFASRYRNACSMHNIVGSRQVDNEDDFFDVRAVIGAQGDLLDFGWDNNPLLQFANLHRYDLSRWSTRSVPAASSANFNNPRPDIETTASAPQSMMYATRNLSHAIGVILSRAWPAARAKVYNRPQPGVCSGFDAFLGTVNQRRRLWDGHFSLSHFVPQVIWMGIWLEERESGRLP